MLLSVVDRLKQCTVSTVQTYKVSNPPPYHYHLIPFYSASSSTFLLHHLLYFSTPLSPTAHCLSVVDGLKRCSVSTVIRRVIHPPHHSPLTRSSVTH